MAIYIILCIYYIIHMYVRQTGPNPETAKKTSLVSGKQDTSLIGGYFRLI